MEVFQNLDPLLRMFWFIALPASAIFIVQTIMTFIGADASDGLNADFDGDMSGGDAPFQLFSLRNLVNFLLGFGWTGVSCFRSIENKTILLFVAVIVGIVFVFMFFVIIRQIQKLAEDNSFKLSSTLNKTADVYLAIPEKKSGKGKIMISINGSYHELDAMTENERIPTGAVVKIVKIENSDILIVELI
ncbi:MAG: NfeD family protein [Paludibacter sp.]|nr:NfeD family protein [Paludibacter sp.]